VVWYNDIVLKPEIPSPESNGWKVIDGEWIPVMTLQLPAPQCILHLPSAISIKVDAEQPAVVVSRRG